MKGKLGGIRMIHNTSCFLWRFWKNMDKIFILVGICYVLSDLELLYVREYLCTLYNKIVSTFFRGFVSFSYFLSEQSLCKRPIKPKSLWVQVFLWCKYLLYVNWNWWFTLHVLHIFKNHFRVDLYDQSPCFFF
jgi:hypothetical protein